MEKKFVHSVLGGVSRSPVHKLLGLRRTLRGSIFVAYTRAAQNFEGKEKQIHTRISTSRAVPADGQAGTRAVAISMYCVLLASYAVNAADRQLFPLLGYDVRQQYGFSLADTGLLSTIFTLGLAVAGLPTGYLLARFPRKTVLLFGIGIFSTGTALTVLSIGFSDMLVYFVATGIGEAMQLTVMIPIPANSFVGYRAA